MQIHVIRSGDSLWNLSRAYNTTVEAITSANELDEERGLVIGQALVIPIIGSYYWVAPGDSLYIISQRLDVPVNVLAQVNNIQNPNQLRVGMRLYIPPKNKPPKEIAAYVNLETSRENAALQISAVADKLTYANIFSYNVNLDASLTPPVNVDAAIEAAINNNVAPLMVIANIEEGGFSEELITVILSSESLQNTLFDNALTIIEEKGYRGIDFDFEFLGRANRERYNTFIQRAVDFFRPKGYLISSALAPKLSTDQIGTLYEGHDYDAHGRILDFVFLMTYEWGWSGGADQGL